MHCNFYCGGGVGGGGLFPRDMAHILNACIVIYIVVAVAVVFFLELWHIC